MKITVVGASGLIGTKVVGLLEGEGHEVVAASRSSGVDVLTGDGLAAALAGANVLVDLLNSPSFEDDPVMDFFTTSTTNLVAAAKAAGVGNYVALSIVGVDGLPDSGYMRAKVMQENIITESGLPYTILRATQFAEFTDAIVNRPDVQQAISKIDYSVYSDAEAQAQQYGLLTTFLDIVLTDGRQFSARVDAAKGSATMPMDEAEIAAKFRECAEFAHWPPERTEQLISLILRLEELDDLSSFTELLRASA